MELSTEYASAVGIFLVLVGASWYCYYWIKQRQITSPNAKHYTSCSSSECVRCHKYEITRKSARIKILEYQSVHNIGSDRITSAAKESQVVFQNDLQQPNVLYVPGLLSTPWWERHYFENDLQKLEDQSCKISKEMWNVYYGEKSHEGWTSNKTDHGSWHTFYLYNQGKEIIENCEQCPATHQVIKELEAFLGTGNCLFGNALFSVLYPHTNITEHYGPTNIRIRCHLGLSVPTGCSLTVANRTEEWREGKCLLFDDSFIHSATHNGQQSEPRAVLMLDFWHPQLSSSEKDTLLHAFSMQQ